MRRSENSVVVLGGAAGAWGDSSFALPQLLDSERCDYIFLDGLAEITMAILARARHKDPGLGYATDIISMIGRELPRIAQQGVRIVTSAGGVHPRAAADLLRGMAAEAGVGIRIACVEGDDLIDRLDELSDLDLAEMSDGGPLVADPLSFNAYLGARPIAAALGAGADLVITGRCVDSALALGPLMHEFGWGLEDFDLLSQGSLAGHLLECGPQATGGLLTDWRDVASWHDIGYPIAECRADGSFVLTKAEGTGGLVDVRGAAEQLLYEIGDPGAYLLPDVTCDWRHVELRQAEVDRVEVKGAIGRPPPATLKACAQVADGFKVTALLMIGGREAAAKASRLGSELTTRAARLLERDGHLPLRNVDVEVLGAESTYGPHARTPHSREVMIKISMHHDKRSALSAIVRELGSFAMVVTGLSAGGRGLPKPTPLIQLRSYLIPRDRFAPAIHLDGASIPCLEPSHAAPVARPADSKLGHEPIPVDELIEVPLVALAHARSGDKGPDANIGVRARHRDFLPLLRNQLTTRVVADWFAHRARGRVERYELPGMDALNFVLRDALGGGGISSLRFDAQGKAYAQQLLDMPLRIPRAWLTHSALSALPSRCS